MPTACAEIWIHSRRIINRDYSPSLHTLPLLKKIAHHYHIRLSLAGSALRTCADREGAQVFWDTWFSKQKRSNTPIRSSEALTAHVLLIPLKDYTIIYASGLWGLYQSLVSQKIERTEIASTFFLSTSGLPACRHGATKGKGSIGSTQIKDKLQRYHPHLSIIPGIASTAS